jgi:hypothetical protein
MISAETIVKFKNLYKEKFNISLNDEEATQMTTDLVNLVSVLLKPEPIETNEHPFEGEAR